MNITVETRSGDYMAYLNGNRGQWGSGASIDEAIGSAIRTHASTLGISIDTSAARGKALPPTRTAKTS